ncbi:hypothetical protein F53441_3202 [Fusarium austroafricanum]|uniref:DJ-1/PfpI domain-containing protein n=1 Tax=Fusarium austroafricanum TaxID=2364996 RepID=A0A8H4PAX9_9HYPO|nr:hypothetical protein F53441_3202 [Fusarium austroafricanum]
MSTTIDLARPNRPIQVGVLLMNRQVKLHETEILDVAPIDFMNGISKQCWKSMFEGFVPDKFAAQTIDMEFHWVSKAGPATPCKLTSGIKLVATDSFETCPPLDVVLMGANGGHYQPDAEEIAFMRKAYDECSAFLCICGGVLAPLQAGILNGKTATGPLAVLDTVRQQAPDVNWVTKRWVRDGKLWTSGALLNGTDMMTNFMKHYWGGEGSLVEFLASFGGWPDRDIDYKEAA